MYLRVVACKNHPDTLSTRTVSNERIFAGIFWFLNHRARCKSIVRIVPRDLYQRLLQGTVPSDEGGCCCVVVLALLGGRRYSPVCVPFMASRSSSCMCLLAYHCLSL